MVLREILRKFLGETSFSVQSWIIERDVFTCHYLVPVSSFMKNSSEELCAIESISSPPPERISDTE